MDRDYGDTHYSSAFVEDAKQGIAGMELHETRHGEQARVARVIFWDVCGRFYVETFNRDVPLDILEELVREAKERLNMKRHRTMLMTDPQNS